MLLGTSESEAIRNGVGRVQAGDGLQLLEADRPRPPPLRTRSPSRVGRTYRAYLCLSVTVRGAQHLAVLCSVARVV